MKNKQCPKSSTPYQSAIKANLSTDRKEVCPKMYDEKGAPITKSVTAVSKAVCQEKLEELKVKCGVVTGRAKSDMPFGESTCGIRPGPSPACGSRRSSAMRIGSTITSFRTSIKSL